VPGRPHTVVRSVRGRHTAIRTRRERRHPGVAGVSKDSRPTVPAGGESNSDRCTCHGRRATAGQARDGTGRVGTGRVGTDSAAGRGVGRRRVAAHARTDGRDKTPPALFQPLQQSVAGPPGENRRECHRPVCETDTTSKRPSESDTDTVGCTREHSFVGTPGWGIPSRRES